MTGQPTTTSRRSHDRTTVDKRIGVCYFIGMNDTLSRLQPGHVIALDAVEYVVAMVNDSRALCYPITKVKRTVTPSTGVNAGKQIEIEATGAPISISPNSLCPILRTQAVPALKHKRILV